MVEFTRFIWGLVKDIAVLAGMAAIIFAFFALAMLPQVGFGFFIAAGGGAMIPPMIGMLLLGILARRHPQSRWMLYLIAMTIFVMSSMRGFYWHPFPRGHGFFTANRMTGLAIIAITFAAPEIWSRASTKLRSRKAK